MLSRSDGLRRPALLCLGAALACSGTLLIVLGSQLIFTGDDWATVVYRRGLSPDVFLDPFHGHIYIATTAVYKLLLATFGMTSPVPFHVVSTLAFLASAVLLFAYVRRRVGDWLALAFTSLILFFGAASVDLLLSYQMGFSGSVAAGLGALLALDRNDRRGDLFACVLLATSIAWSDVGIAFCAAAAADVALGERSRRARAYVPLVPLALYGLWWLGWGHTDPSALTWHNLATAPRFTLDAAAAAVGALLGIVSPTDQAPRPVGQEWAPALLALAVALAVWRLRRVGGASRGFWVALVGGLTFWLLIALNYIPLFRDPGNGRSLYPSAVFMILIAAELLRGVKLSGRALVAVAAGTVVAVAGNVVFLRDGYEFFFKPASQLSRGGVSALEIAGPERPFTRLDQGLMQRTLYNMDANSYLSAVNAFGSPAYTESELATAPEGTRAEADRIFVSLLGITLRPGGPTGGRCHTAQVSTDTRFEVGPGTTVLEAGAGNPSRVLLGRFSDELPADLGSLRPGVPASLSIPADRSDRPWQLGLSGNGPVTFCTRRSGGPA